MENIICEIYGSFGSYVAVNEIEFYDLNNTRVSFSVTATDEYESRYGGTPTNYWNREIWDKTKLNNGIVKYGESGSTIFNFTGTGDYTTAWTRFLIKLNIDSIQNLKLIKVNVGGELTKTPKKISFFYGTNYVKEQHLNIRDNIGLFFMGENIFSTDLSTPTEFNIIPTLPLKHLYLIKQNNQYYTIKSEFYPVGQDILTKEMVDKYGSDSLTNFTSTFSTNSSVMTSSGVLGAGQQFSVDLNSEMLSLNNAIIE